MAHHYLGKASDGRIVSRKSTNPHFTHAAIIVGKETSRLPNFSTSPAGAERNFYSNHSETSRCEVVEVKEVTAKEYKAATGK